ncbi:MAG: heavy-metal-associated domain-containing protein [Gemmobacter sp.]|nr:heavy-metal-associated domain-containing protein [Gemmobacter sp.]
MSLTLSIPDMSCGHCRASIEAALKPLSGIAAVRFDAEARTATVEGSASADEIVKVLDSIGFPASPLA